MYIHFHSKQQKAILHSISHTEQSQLFHWKRVYCIKFQNRYRPLHKAEKEIEQLNSDINVARTIIKTSTSELEKIIEEDLKNENYGYKINYGYNYFPEKEYNGKTYESGNYESLLITLGEGKGENWWCILFPPLCLIEAEESEKVEYSFFLEELLYNILH